MTKIKYASLFAMILVVLMGAKGCTTTTDSTKTLPTPNTEEAQTENRDVPTEKNEDTLGGQKVPTGTENPTGTEVFSTLDLNTVETLKQTGTPSSEKQETANVETAPVGVYASYDASLVGSREKTVLFFNASWCPSCKSAEKNLKASVADIPGNLIILDVDYDTYGELKKKYGVVYQHTFVEVDANGEKIKSWNGGYTLKNVVKNLS